jgi:hypothetical protein
MTEPDATPTSAAPAPEEQAGYVPVPAAPRADASASEVPPAELSAPRAPPPGKSVPEVRLPGDPGAHPPPPHVPLSKTPVADGPPQTLPESPSPPPARHGLAWLAAAAIVVLALLQAALWVRVLVPPPGSGPLEQRVQAIEARVAALERRPAPVGAAQPAPTATAQPAPAAAAGPTAAAPDLGPLETRIAALEQRPLPAPAPNPDASLATRVTADEARLVTLEKTAELPAQLADRANRVARIQAAFIALSFGRPLGDLPGAPPALARYATTAPPTEAALRLGLPAAAQAALAANHPAPGDRPFLERIWAEAQDLVTIRQGEHVLVGDPAAGVLAHAQTALDAGDLAGAVASVGSLSGPAAQALAGWLDQARGLIAARAALADLAAQT